MSDFEVAEKSLKTILKKGDVFDAVCQKENKYLENYPFLKTNILIFSRILYLGTWLITRIKSGLVPLVKIKNAQDEIRNILGFPIDIIRSKKKVKFFDFHPYKPYLNIFYENEGVNNEVYIKHLNEILKFCELHNISHIMLKVEDILKINSSILFEEEFSAIRINELSEILDVLVSLFDDENDEIISKLDEDVLILNQDNLRCIIEKLENSLLDSENLLNFSDKINDTIIKKAVLNYLKYGNLYNLKMIVQERLTDFINSDNFYKDKVYGKIQGTVQIKEKYIKIIEKSSDDKVIQDRVMTLCEYLEVSNYESLLKKVKTSEDNKEILYIAAFYLYLTEILNETSKKTIDENKNFLSLYDCYFKAYCDKKNKKINKVPGLYTSYEKFAYWFVSSINFLVLFSKFYISLDLSSKLIDSFRIEILNEEELDLTGVLIKDVLDIYKNSWNLEISFYESLCDFIDYSKENNSDKQNKSFNVAKWLNSSKSIAGDADGIENDEQILATITPLKDDISLPYYYAESQSFLADYSMGEKKYFLRSDTINSIHFQDVEPLFEIRHDFVVNDFGSFSS